MYGIIFWVSLALSCVGVTASVDGSKKDLTVVMVESPPYLMRKEEHDPMKGNMEFEGFGVDLVKVLEKQVKIKVNIKVVDKYGSTEPNGTWNGMVGELIDGKADMAIADLTITESREKVIDFSMPFMEGGIQMLARKSEVVEVSQFSFLDPFTTDVWIVIITSYLGMFLLYIIPVCINKKKPESEDKEKTPISLNCLKITTIIFTVFIVCIYSANLGLHANGGIKWRYQPVETVDDLARQNQIKYGCVKDGATAAFFRNSKVSVFNMLWDTMSENSSMFTNNAQEGIERVRHGDGKFVFFLESNMAEYVTERKCDLMAVGDKLNKISYGIGLPLNSELRKPINNALLKLESDGTLRRLKFKWWIMERGGGACMSGKTFDITQMDLQSIAGVFWLLLVCLICVIITFACESLWKVYQRRV